MFTRDASSVSTFVECISPPLFSPIWLSLLQIQATKGLLLIAVHVAVCSSLLTLRCVLPPSDFIGDV